MIARFSGYNQLYIIKLGIFKLFIEITTLLSNNVTCPLNISVHLFVTHHQLIVLSRR